MGQDGSIAERLRGLLERLTPTERRAALVLLSHYPIAGLESITQFARRSGVSGATVLRLLGKLGLSGYPEFQDTLRRELAAQLESPLGRWQARRPAEGGDGGDFLTRYGDQVIEDIRHTLQGVSRADFDSVVELLCAQRNRVHVIGGRLTGPLAAYLAAHLRAARPGVHEASGQSATWPDQLLNVGRRDAVVAFDVRRYQPDVALFAERAAERGAKVVLFTDEWQSPIAAAASYILTARTTSPSGWDSVAALVAVVEALIAAVSERLGGRFAERMNDLEGLRRAWPGVQSPGE